MARGIRKEKKLVCTVFKLIGRNSKLRLSNKNNNNSNKSLILKKKWWLIHIIKHIIIQYIYILPARIPLSPYLFCAVVILRTQLFIIHDY